MGFDFWKMGLNKKEMNGPKKWICVKQKRMNGLKNGFGPLKNQVKKKI